MGINRIRLQNGAMGDPRVDARMQQTYQQNIADNQAQQARNEGILQAAANRLFPEGNFQQIRANAPDQATYNIDATADLVRNNPFGIIGEVAAPALTAATSVPYDVIQGIGRAVDQSDVDTSPYAGIVDDTEIPTGPSLSDLGQAIDAENPLSSALERTIGAATPLAERMSGINLGMSSATAAETPTPDAGTDRPTMADVAGPTTDASGKTYYDDGSYTIPGFTRLKNPDGAPGNYNEFMYKGPDGQIYGSETYGAISAGRYPDIYDPSKQTLASGGRVGFQDGTDPNLTARQVAEQNPELNTIREQLFGENYLDDIEQGTGIAQYYTGFGEMPTLDYTPPVVEEAAPAVDVTQPIVDTGGGGGSDIDITTPDTGDAPINIDTPLTQMITTPTGDTMTVKEAITTDQIYSPMSGGVTGDPIEVEDLTTPSNIGDFAITAAGDLPDQTGTISGAPVIGDFNEPTTGTISDNRLNEVIGGQPMAAGPFDYLQPTPISEVQVPGLDYSQADIDAERLASYTPSFETPEQTNAINEAFNSVKDLGAAGVDKLRDSLVALGGKVKEGFDNTIEIGGKTIDLGKSLIGGAISLATGVPGVGFALNALGELKTDPADTLNRNIVDELKSENDYGYSMSSGTLNQDPFGRNPVSAFGDYEQTLLDDIDSGSNTKMGLAKKEFAQDYFDKKAGKVAPQEDIGAVSGDYGAALDDTSSAADISQDLASQQATANAGGGNVMDEFGSGGDTQATTGPTVSRSDADYGQFGRAQSAQAGGGGNQGGGGKIVCTMMNDSYGFGSFRNKIWLKHSKDMKPEYQIGYHKIFLPLVKLSKTNKVLKKTLEHIAVHRTIDIRQEARGKVHLLGRVYRKILEPICYVVGKYVK